MDFCIKYLNNGGIPKAVKATLKKRLLYILTVKLIFGRGKREFSEAPQLIRASYCLPVEGTMF